MRRVVNPEMEKALRRAAGDSDLISALMQSLWRGASLLVAYVAQSGRSMRIRMQGKECLPAFTSQETAQAFEQMLLEQGGPALSMRQETVESLLYPTADCALAVDAGQSTGVVLEPSTLASVVNATARLTGGRAPGEDLPLMRLHMESVGNAERAVRSARCGCFHCGQTFAPEEIERFHLEQDGRRTALCPRCGVDAVLTEMDALPLTDRLIELMNHRFFGGADSEEDGVLRLMYMQCVRERLDAQRGETGAC